MISERIGQAALRAYPPAVRQTRGPEMLGMLLDAGEQSSGALVRETGSLVLGGLRERRAITTRARTRRLVADSCCQAVLIWLTLWVISAVNTQAVIGPTQRLLVQELVLATILACALIGFERIAAAGGLAAIAAFGPLALNVQVVWLAQILVPISCLLVMVCAPRTRPLDARRLLLLLPVVGLAGLQPHVYVGLPAVLALISVGGLLRVFRDPRSAIACGLVWMILVTAHVARPGHAQVGPLVMIAVMAAGLLPAVAAGGLWITRHGDAA